MGWVTEFPKCLEKFRFSFPQTSGVSDKGRCLHTEVGKREEMKNQNEMDILKSQFSGWQIELCVYREGDVLSSHPPWVFTQKSQNKPKSSFLPVKKMLIYSKNWF